MAKRFPSGNCIGTLYIPQLLAGPRPVLQRVPVRLECLRPRRRRAPVHPVDVDPVGRAHPGLEHLHFDRLGHQVVRCCSRHPTTLASITAPIAELRHTPSLPMAVIRQQVGAALVLAQNLKGLICWRHPLVKFT
jgi:hypothetical protein